MPHQHLLDAQVAHRRVPGGARWSRLHDCRIEVPPGAAIRTASPGSTGAGAWDRGGRRTESQGARRLVEGLLEGGRGRAPRRVAVVRRAPARRPPARRRARPPSLFPSGDRGSSRCSSGASRCAPGGTWRRRWQVDPRGPPRGGCRGRGSRPGGSRRVDRNEGAGGDLGPPSTIHGVQRDAQGRAGLPVPRTPRQLASASLASSSSPVTGTKSSSA